MSVDGRGPSTRRSSHAGAVADLLALPVRPPAPGTARRAIPPRSALPEHRPGVVTSERIFRSDWPTERVGSTTLLHVESDNPATVVDQALARGAIYAGRTTIFLEQYREVCKGPCDERLAKSGTYYFSGPGIPASSDFNLVNAGDHTTAHVEAGSVAGVVGGYTLATSGALFLTAGAVPQTPVALEVPRTRPAGSAPTPIG